MIQAVIDTNVLVSALLARNADSPTVKTGEAVLRGEIVPLHDDAILREYRNVLTRPKFRFPEALVEQYLAVFRERGLESDRVHCDEPFADPSDAVFYEVALSKDGASLVTGNIRHFPKNPIVVTPAEMMRILAGAGRSH